MPQPRRDSAGGAAPSTPPRKAKVSAPRGAAPPSPPSTPKEAPHQAHGVPALPSVDVAAPKAAQPEQPPSAPQSCDATGGRAWVKSLLGPRPAHWPVGVIAAPESKATAYAEWLPAGWDVVLKPRGDRWRAAFVSPEGRVLPGRVEVLHHEQHCRSKSAIATPEAKSAAAAPEAESAAAVPEAESAAAVPEAESAASVPEAESAAAAPEAESAAAAPEAESAAAAPRAATPQSGDLSRETPEKPASHRRVVSRMAMRNFVVVCSEGVDVTITFGRAGRKSGHLAKGQVFAVDGEAMDQHRQLRYLRLADGAGWVAERSRRQPARLLVQPDEEAPGSESAPEAAAQRGSKRKPVQEASPRPQKARAVSDSRMHLAAKALHRYVSQRGGSVPADLLSDFCEERPVHRPVFGSVTLQEFCELHPALLRWQGSGAAPHVAVAEAPLAEDPKEAGRSGAMAEVDVQSAAMGQTPRRAQPLADTVVATPKMWRRSVGRPRKEERDAKASSKQGDGASPAPKMWRRRGRPRKEDRGAQRGADVPASGGRRRCGAAPGDERAQGAAAAEPGEGEALEASEYAELAPPVAELEGSAAMDVTPMDPERVAAELEEMTLSADIAPTDGLATEVAVAPCVGGAAEAAFAPCVDGAAEAASAPFIDGAADAPAPMEESPAVAAEMPPAHIVASPPTSAHVVSLSAGRLEHMAAKALARFLAERGGSSSDACLLEFLEQRPVYKDVVDRRSIREFCQRQAALVECTDSEEGLVLTDAASRAAAVLREASQQELRKVSLADDAPPQPPPPAPADLSVVATSRPLQRRPHGVPEVDPALRRAISARGGHDELTEVELNYRREVPLRMPSTWQAEAGVYDGAAEAGGGGSQPSRPSALRRGPRAAVPPLPLEQEETRRGVKFDLGESDEARLQIARERLAATEAEALNIERWAERRVSELRRRGESLRQQVSQLQTLTG